jgi:hypothetical protein
MFACRDCDNFSTEEIPVDRPHISGIRIALASAALVCSTAVAPALADPYRFSASGVFDALAPLSGFSAPSATWSVSFLFNANPPLFPDPGFSFAANFSNADIRVNGAPILLVPTLFGVYNAGNSGGMDMFFGDTANGSNAIEFFGPQVYTGSEQAPTIVPGVYMTSATGPSITGFSVVIDGTRTNQGAAEFTITAIPLPPTLLLGMAGFALPAGAGLRRRAG